jgi:uncharacterized protein (TIGR02145 family)
MKNMFRISIIILLIISIHSCKKEDKNVIKDIDGNVYKSVTIGIQVWMVENLKTTRYRNGDLIGTTDPATKDITSESTPKYQWAPAGDESNVETYGRLYTWYTVTDNRNLCPTGWHVPTDAEWTTLENYLIGNGYNFDGTTTGNKIAKALASTSLFLPSTTPGTPGNTDYPAKRNETGFTAYPSGLRSYLGSFDFFGQNIYWWAAPEDEHSYASYWAIGCCATDLVNYSREFDNYDIITVRCLKN